MQLVRSLAHHRLSEHAKFAGLQLSFNQNAILRKLEMAVVWAARYPVSRSPTPDIGLTEVISTEWADIQAIADHCRSRARQRSSRPRRRSSYLSAGRARVEMLAGADVARWWQARNRPPRAVADAPSPLPVAPVVAHGARQDPRACSRRRRARGNPHRRKPRLHRPRRPPDITQETNTRLALDVVPPLKGQHDYRYPPRVGGAESSPGRCVWK